MRFAIISATFLLILAGPVPAEEAGSERPESGWTGEAEAGYRDVDVDGSAVRAAEFRSLDGSAYAHIKVAAPFSEAGLVSFHGTVRDSDEQAHHLRLEAGRAFRLDLEYDRFVHNLDHDPLSNLEAVNEIKVVQHTDFDPDAAYQIRYSEARAHLRGKAPDLPGLYYGVEVRDQKREGSRQALTTGHCFSCHITSRSQEVDETTRDIAGYIGYQGKNWDLQYRLTDRQFDPDGATSLITYDIAHRPNNPALRVFEDRVQYDDDEGPLPYALVPETEKQAHVIKGHWRDRSGGSLSGALTTSTVTNNDTRLEIGYDGGRVRYHRPFRDGKLGLTLGYRHEKINSDDVFVDVAERAAIAGPYAGNTFEDVFGNGGLYGRTGNRAFVADFTRKSALDRSTRQGKASLRYRMPHRQSLRVEFTRREIDRNHFAVTDHGETKTSENRLRAILMGRPGKQWRYRAELDHKEITRPFNNVNGGCQLEALDVYGTSGTTSVPPGPNGPLSLQYYEVHNLRRANLSNVPTSITTLKANATYARGPKAAWTFTGRANQKENDKTQAVHWEHDGLMLGANFWFAPAPRWYGTASFTIHRDEYTTQVCAPIMDG